MARRSGRPSPGTDGNRNGADMNANAEATTDALHEDIVIAWQYRQDALHTRLLNLLCTLDPDNTERARLGFPDHVRALERYRHEPGWWNGVQTRRDLNP